MANMFVVTQKFTNGSTAYYTLEPQKDGFHLTTDLSKAAYFDSANDDQLTIAREQIQRELSDYIASTDGMPHISQAPEEPEEPEDLIPSAETEIVLENDLEEDIVQKQDIQTVSKEEQEEEEDILKNDTSNESETTLTEETECQDTQDALEETNTVPLESDEINEKLDQILEYLRLMSEQNDITAQESKRGMDHLVLAVQTTNKNVRSLLDTLNSIADKIDNINSNSLDNIDLNTENNKNETDTSSEHSETDELKRTIAEQENLNAKRYWVYICNNEKYLNGQNIVGFDKKEDEEDSVHILSNADGSGMIVKDAPDDTDIDLQLREYEEPVISPSVDAIQYSGIPMKIEGLTFAKN